MTSRRLETGFSRSTGGLVDASFDKVPKTIHPPPPPTPKGQCTNVFAMNLNGPLLHRELTVHEAEAERLQAEWEDNAKQANEKVR